MLMERRQSSRKLIPCPDSTFTNKQQECPEPISTNKQQDSNPKEDFRFITIYITYIKILINTYKFSNCKYKATDYI